MSRPQLVLAALLVVQILLIAVTRGPFAGSGKVVESTALLPMLESVAAAKLEISGPNDQTVTLMRDGTLWTVREADGYPADDSKVQALIDKLKDVKVRRPIVTASRYHQALKVTDQDYERRLRIWDEPSGSPDAGLYLGTSPNYRITHVRREGDDRVYEVSGLAAFDVQYETNGWILTKLIDTDPASVTKVKVENARGRFEVEKGEDGTWTVTSPASGRGTKVDDAKVTEMVRLATNLNVSQPAGTFDRQAQGFQRPAVTVTLNAAPPSGISVGGEGNEVVLMIGGAVEGEDNKRYVTRAGFNHAGIVFESAVDKLIEQRLSDLR